MFETIAYSLVHGFAIYTLIGLLIRPSLSPKNKQAMDRFDYSACQIGALAGFIYLALSAVDTLGLGRYSIPAWIQLLMLLSVQLLWLGKLHTIKWVRFLIAVMLLFSLEGWVMLISGYGNFPLIVNLSFLVQIGVWVFDLVLLWVVSVLFYWLKMYFRR